jgi:hypothetical protein
MLKATPSSSSRGFRFESRCEVSRALPPRALRLDGQFAIARFTTAQFGIGMNWPIRYCKVEWPLLLCHLCNCGSHRLFKLHVLYSHLARLNTSNELDEVRILYFQCVLDQRSGLSWY